MEYIFAIVLVVLVIVVMIIRLRGKSMYGKPFPVQYKHDIEQVANKLLRGELGDDHFFTLTAKDEDMVVQIIGWESIPMLYITTGNPRMILTKLGFQDKGTIKDATPSLLPMQMVSDEYGVYAGIESSAEAIADWSETIFREVFGVSRIADLTIYHN